MSVVVVDVEEDAWETRRLLPHLLGAGVAGEDSQPSFDCNALVAAGEEESCRRRGFSLQPRSRLCPVAEPEVPPNAAEAESVDSIHCSTLPLLLTSASCSDVRHLFGP